MFQRLQRFPFSVVVLNVTMVEPARLDESDEIIVESVRHGDTDAFRALVVRYERPVFRLLRHLAPSHVAVPDLAQDVFLAAFLGLSSFDARRGRFSSWIYTIAKHHAINARKKHVAVAVGMLPEAATQDTPADDLARCQLRRRLDNALARLSEEQRNAFVLSEFVGLSTQEIAELERCALPTIRSRLSRARAALFIVATDEEDVT